MVVGARCSDLLRRLREVRVLPWSTGARGGGHAPTQTCFLPYVFQDAATVMKFGRGDKSVGCRKRHLDLCPNWLVPQLARINRQSRVTMLGCRREVVIRILTDIKLLLLSSADGHTRREH